MDGIFGVGVAEVIMIGLVLFIIGGPENTAKWARELGRWVRKGRKAWADVMAQLEQELGDEGKEIVDAARDVGKEVRQLRSATSSRGLVRSALESDLGENSKPKAGAPTRGGETPESTEEMVEAADSREDRVDRTPDASYPAWLPPKPPVE